MTRVPSLDDLFALATSNSRVPLDEVKRHPHGKRFDLDVEVAPRDADCTATLEAADPTMMKELADVRAEDFRATRHDTAYPFC